MPPIDLNAPLFPFLPGTGFEQVGAVLGSIAMTPLLYLGSQFGAIGSTGLASDSIMRQYY